MSPGFERQPSSAPKKEKAPKVVPMNRKRFETNAGKIQKHPERYSYAEIKDAELRNKYSGPNVLRTEVEVLVGQLLADGQKKLHPLDVLEAVRYKLDADERLLAASANDEEQKEYSKVQNALDYLHLFEELPKEGTHTAMRGQPFEDTGEKSILKGKKFKDVDLQTDYKGKVVHANIFPKSITIESPLKMVRDVMRKKKLGISTKRTSLMNHPLGHHPYRETPGVDERAAEITPKPPRREAPKPPIKAEPVQSERKTAPEPVRAREVQQEEEVLTRAKPVRQEEAEADEAVEPSPESPVNLEEWRKRAKEEMRALVRASDGNLPGILGIIGWRSRDEKTEFETHLAVAARTHCYAYVDRELFGAYEDRDHPDRHNKAFETIIRGAVDAFCTEFVEEMVRKMGMTDEREKQEFSDFVKKGIERQLFLPDPKTGDMFVFIDQYFEFSGPVGIVQDTVNEIIRVLPPLLNRVPASPNGKRDYTEAYDYALSLSSYLWQKHRR